MLTLSPYSLFSSQRRHEHNARAAGHTSTAEQEAPLRQEADSLYSVPSRNSGHSWSALHNSRPLTPPSPICFSPTSYPASRRSSASIDMAVVSTTSFSSRVHNSGFNTLVVSTSATSLSMTGSPIAGAPRSQRSLRSTPSESSHSSSPRPSIDSLHTPRKTYAIPPPLQLNHDLPPPPPPKPNATNSLPVTPTSPEFQQPSEEERCQRRLEKLTRTLGEAVPVELVFQTGAKNLNRSMSPSQSTPIGGQSTRQKHKGTKSVRRASISLSTFTNLSLVTASLLPVHSRNSSIKSREIAEASSNRPSLSKDATPERPRPESTILSPMSFSKAIIPPIPPYPTAQAFALIIDDTDLPRTSTDSSRSRSPQNHSARQRPDHLTSDVRPDTPFADSIASDDPELSPTAPSRLGRHATVVRREKRQGWSGEWNRGDMQDVIQQLRSLR
ncbi:hypothetical protein BD779DRAFT_510767 [Infundibulicybe gibba]|nr:hypothetical protein BD779DRAFT_510767 [Infundibulicybe gibba]